MSTIYIRKNNKGYEKYYGNVNIKGKRIRKYIGDSKPYVRQLELDFGCFLTYLIKMVSLLVVVSGSNPYLINDRIFYKNAHIEIASHTGSIPNLTKLEKLYASKDAHINIASHTGSIPNLTKYESIVNPYIGDMDISIKHKDNLKNTSSISFMSEKYEYENTLDFFGG